MILALHGNVGSTRDFDAVFEHGASQILPMNLWPLSHLSLQQAAEAITAKAMADHSGQRGILGYSMGGRLALQALANFPQCWDFGIVISAHPGLPLEVDKVSRLETDREWARTLQKLPWEDFLKRWNQQSILKGSIPEGQSELEPYRKEIAAAFQNWSLGRQEDLREKLRTFHGPLVWIAGENDPKFSTIAREMALRQPENVQLRLVPGCGHRILLERPEVVAAVCHHWFPFSP